MSGKTWRWIGLLMFLVSVVIALRLIGPSVPNEIIMLTGPDGTTFRDDGLRYKEILGSHGITVHLEQTGGSAENLRRLIEAEDPTAAFVWGLRDIEGLQREVPEGIESLGTMYLQPLWVFARRGASPESLRDLQGQRVEAGEIGSDSQMLAVFLLQQEGVGDDVEFTQDNPVTLEEVDAAIENDQVGAFIAVGEPDSDLIDTLMHSPELQVMSIERAEAFAIRFPFLQAVRFPEGAQDLRANIPDHDLQLLAARSQLLVSDLFPPAIADLLLQAATQIHGAPTAFSARGEFPNSESEPLPLKLAAENFYTNGPPKLQKFLPFRLAALINRFLAAAAAIASAGVTIFKLIPALVGLPFRLSVRRGYDELRKIELSAAAGTDKKTLLDQWASVERSTASIKVPLRSLETPWLELRQYLHDMRDRLESH